MFHRYKLWRAYTLQCRSKFCCRINCDGVKYLYSQTLPVTDLQPWKSFTYRLRQMSQYRLHESVTSVLFHSSFFLRLTPVQCDNVTKVSADKNNCQVNVCIIVVLYHSQTRCNSLTAVIIFLKINQRVLLGYLRPFKKADWWNPICTVKIISHSQ